jgi:Leucine-rich repeat (LRR) protein
LGICSSTTSRSWPAYDRQPTVKKLPTWAVRLDQWLANDSRDKGRAKACADLADCIRRKSASLELGDCDLADLPEECWRALAHLKKLSLTRVTGISGSIGELRNLNSFSLTGSPLETLPAALGQLTNLSHLLLMDNRLASLPDSIGKLRELRVLIVSHNRLRALPESMGALSRLIRLELRFNQLARLPDSLGALQALETLYADHNRLIAVPESVSGLHKLARFDLNDNLLEQLPPEIGELPALRCLTLFNNRLRALPASMQKLSALQHLYARGNQLADLPEGLWDLPELHRLTLDNNRLTSLPAGICRLRGGTEISVCGNPIPEQRIALLRDAIQNRGIIVIADFRVGADGRSSGEPATPEHAARNFGGENAAELEKMLCAFQAGGEENSYQAAFFILLAKLVDTGDFQLNRLGMSRRVRQVVEALYRDADLRAECFAVAETATSSCADSAEAMLQALETAILCGDVANGKYSAREAYGLGLRHFRLDVVREIARRKIESAPGGDPLEVQLAYETGLSMALQLPMLGGDMLFRHLSGVDADDLDSAAAEVRRREAANGGEEVFRYLCDWGPWVALIRKRHASAFPVLENEFSLKMAALDERRGDMPDTDYLNAVNDLSRQRLGAIAMLVQELTAACRKDIERAESESGMRV